MKILLVITAILIIILQCDGIFGFLGMNNVCETVKLLSDSITLIDNVPPIKVEVPSKISPNDVIKIKISSLNNLQFNRLAIQAKSFNDELIGQFNPNAEINTTNCKGISNSAAIFRNIENKSEIVIEWQSPSVIEEAISFNFYVSIIEASILWSPYVTNSIIISKDNDNSNLEEIYNSCDSKKVCIGVPTGCLEERNCNLFGAVFYQDEDFIFELLSMVNHNYVALGISHTHLMSDTSNVECIQETPGVITAYTSWMLIRSAFRQGVDQSIISLVESRFIDGRIYCKIKRDSFSIQNDKIFDLENDKFHLMIASGVQLRDDSVGTHGANRGVTENRVWLKDNNLYSGCGVKKVCFGMPSGCVETRNCSIFSGVEVIDGDFIFDLLSIPNHNYVALGLSQTHLMSDTSNIECIQETPGVITAYTSWMLIRSAFRQGVDQSIISLVESGFIDGRIYCKIKRETLSIKNEETFDLENDKFHLMIASGIQLRDDSVGSHGPNRAVTEERISLTISDITTTPTPSPPTPTPSPTPPNLPPHEGIYEGCDDIKLCYGYPSGCISQRTCHMLTTIQRINGEFFEFEMLSLPIHNYISFGLSQTANMGEASVIECVESSPNTVTAYASWNYFRDNSRAEVNQNIIRLTESSIVNSRIYCKVERNTSSTVRDQKFHLEDQMYYLMMAGGAEIFADVIGMHDHRDISDSKYWLTEPGVVTGAPISPLMLTHGALMIVAWIGLTSIGVVFARYFKPMWAGRQVLGKVYWLLFHMCCLILAIVLTLIGFIIIFIDLGHWHTTVHSVLGCIAFAFSILQVIGGFMRPDPKDEGRPYFNYMHQSFGNITHFLAILTIFYAAPLQSARLSSYYLYVLAGYLTYYILIHLIFSTIDIKGKIKRSKEEKVEAPPKNSPYGLLKTTLLMIHITVITGFTIALILIFTLSL